MIVRENIEFVRGQGPRDILKLGLETVIPHQFRQLKKLDKNNSIQHWYIDSTYNGFYIYLDKTPELDWTKNEEDEVKENIRAEITPLLDQSGLSEYFTYDSHENLDEICYNIKPEYQKVFKKLQGELNKKLQGELNR